MFNILIVDDEIKITQVIKAYLDKEGYNCIVANNGEQALKYFYNNNFDLMSETGQKVEKSENKNIRINWIEL